MKENDFLFHLIRSLTPTERGYFTKFGFKNKSSEDSLYLKLFTFLCKQEEYHEEELKKKFFPNDTHKFRIAKHHLYHRIINCLIEYEKDSGIESVVWKNLSSAKVLIGKGLYASAKKFATNAAKEALLAERYDLVYAAYAVIKDTQASLSVNEEIFAFYNNIAAVQKDCLVKSANILEYRMIFENFKLIESKVSNIDYMSSNYQKEIDTLNQSHLMSDMENAISFESKCLYYICKAYYYNAQKDRQMRMENAKALVNHIESMPEKKSYYDVKYRTAINQYLNSCFATQAFSDFDFYLQKLEESSSTLNPHLSARSFLIIENLRMNKNFAVERAEDNLPVIKRFETTLIVHEKHLPVESFQALYVNSAITFFYLEEFKEALVYVNKILNNVKGSSSKAVTTISKCLNLLIHHELKNEELLSYLIKSYRHEEHEVIGFIISAIEMQNIKKQKPDQTEELLSKWKAIKENKPSRAILKDSYIDRWLEKRIGLN